MRRFAPILALSLAALLPACSGERRLPTEADAPAATLSNATEAAKKPKKPKGSGDLRVKVQPDVWNTQWKNSQGTVSALIEGKDLDKIDDSTVVLVGEDGSVEARRVQHSGPHVRAFFPKGDAIEALLDPDRGETHEVRIEFMRDGTAQSLTASVRIVGPNTDEDDEGDDEDEALALEIQPQSWNFNWIHSNGTVTAFIRGDGLADIDLESIELVGTDPAALPVEAKRAKRSGNHVRAWFSMSEAFATLETPARGERHEIVIRFDGADGATELTDTIKVVGSAPN